MSAIALKADGLPELVMRRTYAAPPELVFSMWTDPQHIMRWWAPHDFTVPYAEFDARPGGRLRIDFQTRDGFVFSNFGEVKEVKPYERLVFTAEYRENERLMVVSLITVTFAGHEGGTKMMVHADVTFAEPEAADSLAGMEQGWSEQMEKLDALLRPELTIKRIFDAPRDLVYACWTEEGHMKNWFYPKGFIVPHSQSDIRPGGGYRSCLRAPDGTDHWVGGVYRELTPPERMVFTHAWQDEAGNSEHETVVTLTFEAMDDGKTRLTFHQAFFLSEASRDGHAEGWNETFDGLEAYLARRKTAS